MSGSIILRVRKGKSKDFRYPYYPEAYWEIVGEDGIQTSISPSYKTITDILVDFRKHELRIDCTRKRKNYTSSLITQLMNTLEDLQQMKLSDYEIENIDIIYLYKQ